MVLTAEYFFAEKGTKNGKSNNMPKLQENDYK